MSLRRKLLFVGVVWGLLSAVEGWSGAITWPFVVGKQVFYFLGVPAFPPVYFYMLGVAIWSLLFFTVGAALDNLLKREDEKKPNKRKKRLRAY